MAFASPDKKAFLRRRRRPKLEEEATTRDEKSARLEQGFTAGHLGAGIALISSILSRSY
jgi:hypothetical protein